MVEGKKAEYVDYMTRQVLELMEAYDPALLWFDADWVDWWTLEDGIRLYNTIREADQDILVNNRVAKRKTFSLDYVTQEQKHFDAAFSKPWEGCFFRPATGKPMIKTVIPLDDGHPPNPIALHLKPIDQRGRLEALLKGVLRSCRVCVDDGREQYCENSQGF